MKKRLFPLFIMLLLTAFGCQNGNQDAEDTAYDLRRDNSPPNYMSNRGDNRENTPDFMADRDKDKQHFVENDITNQNPNFLDLDKTESGGEAGAGNQGNDTEKAKDVIAGTKEFTTDSVWINGNRMWVTVYKKGMLSDDEKNAAEARLHRQLVKALPRYNIEVRVNEDRR